MVIWNPSLTPPPPQNTHRNTSFLHIAMTTASTGRILWSVFSFGWDIITGYLVLWSVEEGCAWVGCHDDHLYISLICNYAIWCLPLPILPPKKIHLFLYMCAYICAALWWMCASRAIRFCHFTSLQAKKSRWMKMGWRWQKVSCGDNMRRTNGVPSITSEGLNQMVPIQF